MPRWPSHSLSFLAFDLGCLEIFKGFFAFPHNEEMVPLWVFPSLHFPVIQCYFKGKQFFQYDVFNSAFSQNKSSVSGTALSLDRYIACSIKVVPESFGLPTGPFGPFVKLESFPLFIANWITNVILCFLFPLRKNTHT